eukprot:5801762-Amphidinium_carterae.1
MCTDLLQDIWVRFVQLDSPSSPFSKLCEVTAVEICLLSNGRVQYIVVCVRLDSMKGDLSESVANLFTRCLVGDIGQFRGE